MRIYNAKVYTDGKFVDGGIDFDEKIIRIPYLEQMEKYHHYILCGLTLHPSSTIPHHTENVYFTRFALLKSRAFSYIFGISVERSGDTWSKVVDKLKTL